jgi:hypothetical protein
LSDEKKIALSISSFDCLDFDGHDHDARFECGLGASRPSNDPDTPGAGKWEINLAMTGGKQPRDWTVSAQRPCLRTLGFRRRSGAIHAVVEISCRPGAAPGVVAPILSSSSAAAA